MGKQHDYSADIRWTGAGDTGTSSYTSYSRDHQVEIPDAGTILGSADPAFRGDPARFNPEQLFVASIGQCHMLWFLHLAATSDVVVREYTDHVTGTMRIESAGAGQFTEVTLHPRVVTDGDVSDETIAELHEHAGNHCFLARSVSFPVRVSPFPVRI